MNYINFYQKSHKLLFHKNKSNLLLLYLERFIFHNKSTDSSHFSKGRLGGVCCIMQIKRYFLVLMIH